jgi:ribose transport system substrate-binding protein
MSLRKKLTLAVSTVAIAGLAGLAGCTSTAGDAGATAPLKKEDLVFVCSVINTTNPYFAANIEGCEVLGEKLGIPVEIVDAEGSSQIEISKIQAILAKGKKAVVFVNTVASSDAPIIVESVKQAGGFVTIWWNKPDELNPADIGNNFVAFQKHSGIESGKCTMNELGKAIGDGAGIIALPGVQDSTTSQTRVAGLKEELATNWPGIELLDVRYSNWDPQLAYQNSKDLIAKYGDQIKGVWTADDGMQIGAMQAFNEAGLLDKVKFVSDGLYPPTIDSILAGEGNNAIVGETFHRGYMASAIGLYTAYLAAIGEINPSELPAEKRDSMFAISCVTPDNMEEYLKWDNDVAGWVDTLIANGPWDTAPVPLVAGGPEKIDPKYAQ